MLSSYLLPEPFAWVDIPAGTVKLRAVYKEYPYCFDGNTIFDVPAFAISKYPITNAQYGKFIEEGGYSKRRWLTEKEWPHHPNNASGIWDEPLFWQESKWNAPEHPVVGVSWYESLAFCAWLGETSGEDIRLVSDKQWQRAAQGPKQLTYPWGSTWDASLCNNSSDGTTPVRQFESLGSSPYGVVDMTGNVTEWCLTEYVFDDPESENKHDGDSCMLRGGSWKDNRREFFSVTLRSGRTMPYGRTHDIGFRCVRVMPNGQTI